MVHKITHGNKILYIKEGRCDLENLINPFRPPNSVSVQVWTNSVHRPKRLSPEIKFHTLKKVAVTLKIKSRSPKSNQLFTPSQHCIYVSLVKICRDFTIYGHGSHLGHVTSIISTNSNFHVPKSLHTKFG